MVNNKITNTPPTNTHPPNPNSKFNTNLTLKVCAWNFVKSDKMSTNVKYPAEAVGGLESPIWFQSWWRHYWTLGLVYILFPCCQVSTLDLIYFGKKIQCSDVIWNIVFYKRKNQNIVLVHILLKELVEHKNRIKLQKFITLLSSIFLSKRS